jgi:hypothetical protein
MCNVFSRQLLVAAWVLGVGSACGQNPDEPLAPATCPLECLSVALEACQPRGACVGETAGSPSSDNFVVRTCFENGVKLHMTRTRAAEVFNYTKVVEQDGRLCRTIETEEGPSGSFVTVKDSNGEIAATIRITSFPRMTVLCGGTEYELDKTTACGRESLVRLAPEMAMMSCVPGSCPGSP